MIGETKWGRITAFAAAGFDPGRIVAAEATEVPTARGARVLEVHGTRGRALEPLTPSSEMMCSRASI